MNIQSLIDAVNRVYARASKQRYDTERYARISRRDLTIGATRFFVFAVISYLANFKTRVVDFARQRRYLRTYRSKSSINRQLRSIRDGQARVERIGRHQYRVIQDRRARPICMGLLYLAADPLSATAVRFVLFLAFWRGSYADITVDAIQRALSIDRGVAAALLRWIRANAGTLDRTALRRGVFYSQRPAWWRYRRNSLSLHGAQITRSDFAPVPLQNGTREEILGSNQYRHSRSGKESPSWRFGGGPLKYRFAGEPAQNQNALSGRHVGYAATRPHAASFARSGYVAQTHHDDCIHRPAKIGNVLSGLHDLFSRARSEQTPPSKVGDSPPPIDGAGTRSPGAVAAIPADELERMTRAEIVRYWRDFWSRRESP